MAKKLVLGLATMAVLSMNSIGFAADSAEQIQKDVQNYNVSSGLGSVFNSLTEVNAVIIYHTTQGVEPKGVVIDGKEVEGVQYFEKPEDLQAWIHGKKENGLRCTNTKELRENYLILDARVAELMQKLLERSNRITATAPEGPLYEMSHDPRWLPVEVKYQIEEQYGIEDPVMVCVNSSKKRYPGGAMGKVKDTILHPLDLFTGTWNSVDYIVDSVTGRRW